MNKSVSFFLCGIIAAFFISSCGGQQSTSSQQHPRVLVIPSDQVLKKSGALEEESINGRKTIVRDYHKYFLNDIDSKIIITSIQDGFIQYGYPLNDLEQTVKNIENREILDDMSRVKKDNKTILLSSAHPDIIIETDYYSQKDYSSRAVSTIMAYSIRAIDAVTSKVVASIRGTYPMQQGQTIGDVLNESLINQMASFTTQIDSYFEDITKNGRDISLRVVLADNSQISMRSMLTDGDVLSDYIIDYIKVNTLGGTYNMSLNSNMEMYFTDIRIKTNFNDGTQYSAYDFARDLSKAFQHDLGLKCTNETQGLCDAILIIQ